MKEDIINLIDNNEIISFDIFDTLVLRNISRPTDVFRTMDKELYDKYKIKNFSKDRIKAEMKSREISDNVEVTIDDIYNELNKSIRNKKILTQIKKIELSRELEFICENPFIKQIYNYCKQKNKKILYISDMYLKSDFIKQILNKCGYDVNDNLYISSECNAIKGDGTLFEYIKKKNNLSFDKWLHIGDNYESDYNQPKKLGMSSYNYKNVNSYSENNSISIFESIILGMKNNWVHCGIKNLYWENFGYNYLVPIYLGYTNWLYNMTYNLDNLFFLARDGYIVKKIYELFPNQNNKYINYLYVSRNSLQIPAMYKNSKDKLLNSFIYNKKNVKLKELFTNCQLELKDKYIRIINQYGFNNFDDIVTEKNEYDAKKCVAACWSDIYNEVNNNYELVEKYLNQENVNNFKIPNVVDIGWGGSIQESIRTILGREVHGYYFGTISVDKKDYMSQSFGFMFDQDYPETTRKKVFNQVMMYELIFSAPHGTTEKYKEENNKIVPILKEKDNYSEIVEMFQNSSIKLISEIMKYYKYYDSINKEFCISFYHNFLCKKNYADLREFKKIENDYELGSNKKYEYVKMIDIEEFENKDNFKKIYNIVNQSLWKGSYLLNQKPTNNIINNIREFEKFRFDIDNKNILDKNYKTYEEYAEIINNNCSEEYYDDIIPLATTYYKKYHSSYIKNVRRKIIPYSLRNKLKKVFKLK